MFLIHHGVPLFMTLDTLNSSLSCPVKHMKTMIHIREVKVSEAIIGKNIWKEWILSWNRAWLWILYFARWVGIWWYHLFHSHDWSWIKKFELFLINGPDRGNRQGPARLHLSVNDHFNLINGSKLSILTKSYLWCTFWGVWFAFIFCFTVKFTV